VRRVREDSLRPRADGPLRGRRGGGEPRPAGAERARPRLLGRPARHVHRVNPDPARASRLSLLATDDADGEQGLAVRAARSFAANGRTAAWLRAQPSKERDAAFWEEVAAELDAVEASAES